VAERWFLKLDGIAGESTHVAHKGEIDVEAWSVGVSRDAPPGGGGGGGGAGKADFDDFHFVSRLSKASPPLLLACATGSHLKEALLSGVKQSESAKGTEFLKYRLADVQVSSFHQSGAEDDGGPVDQFSLSYSKIEVTYTPTTETGKAGKSVKVGYDLKSAKKF
jgi:type VI secretion system secreted protein Hcp